MTTRLGFNNVELLLGNQAFEVEAFFLVHRQERTLLMIHDGLYGHRSSSVVGG